MNRFETKTNIDHDRAIVKVSGYLSGQAGEALEEEVGRLLVQGKRSIVIDFGETEMVNSVGVSILIGVIEKARESKASLSFSSLTQVNEEIFRLMGLHHHVPFVDHAAGAEEKAADVTGESRE